MITLSNLRECNNCGNVFSKTLVDKKLNRCPACGVWKKDTVIMD